MRARGTYAPTQNHANPVSRARTFFAEVSSASISSVLNAAASANLGIAMRGSGEAQRAPAGTATLVETTSPEAGCAHSSAHSSRTALLSIVRGKSSELTSRSHALEQRKRLE